MWPFICLVAASPSGMQVENMLNLRGWHGRSLLASAAFRGDKATFEAVLSAAKARLQPEQVRLTVSLRRQHARVRASQTAGDGLAYVSIAESI